MYASMPAKASSVARTAFVRRSLPTFGPTNPCSADVKWRQVALLLQSLDHLRSHARHSRKLVEVGQQPERGGVLRNVSMSATSLSSCCSVSITPLFVQRIAQPVSHSLLCWRC